MSAAKNGDTVQVHYTGRLDDDTVFDSSEGRDPLKFGVGSGQVIPGFDKGVVGMEIGDKKTITIPPDEAYGPHRDELTLTVNKGQFPEHITPAVGLQLQMQQPDQSNVNVTITSIEGDDVTLDANHPLAGKTLIFDLELVAIN
ncbi:MAG: peptidylprolyl isomerase [Candidatus Zixiibacteriota bacterium]